MAQWRLQSPVVVYLSTILSLSSVVSHTSPLPFTPNFLTKWRSLLTLMLGGALTTKPRATKRDATNMIRSLGFGQDRNAEPQPVDSAVVKLIKRGPEYGHLTRNFSGASDAIDEALVALEHGSYIALPADYPRPNAAWDSLDGTHIENRGVPEHMALLLAQNGPKPTRKKAMRKILASIRGIGRPKTKTARLRKRTASVTWLANT